jgi:hypothetical protein
MTVPCEHSLLGQDDGNLIYRSTALNLLQLYFFTGFLANFGDLVIISTLILGLFVFYVFSVFVIKKCHVPLFSPLIIIYSIITIISLGNHLVWMQEAGLPQGARTMPVVLLTMIACRLCTIQGLFKRGIFMNTLPFVLLIPLGAHIQEGRYYSTFLDENLLGSVLPFAFALGVTSLWEYRYNWKGILTLFPPVFFMFFSARRSMLLYLIASSVTLFIYSIKKSKIRAKQIIYMALPLLFILLVVLPTMTNRLGDRFGDNFQLLEYVPQLIEGDVTDRSTLERRGFIDLSIESTSNYWLGFGNANFPYVVRNYGPGYLSLASNPHSAFADALITAGYLGLLLYIFFLLYFLHIGKKDPLLLLCLVWMAISIFVEANLSHRILWPLLAIAERELQMRKIPSWTGRTNEV